MQLENSFTVPVPIDEAWRVLLDIERIAPCMPGAALDSVDGDDFTGRVKVKLGPINLTYQGKASFIEKDAAAHTAVIDARGKDQRGNGTAAAVVTANLKAEGDITRVHVLTDLNITGRPAQFGRGVMTDVGNKLLGQFADKLAAQLGEGDRPVAPAADATQPITAAGPAGKAAATAAGAAEEIAASAEQTQGDTAPARAVRSTAAAAKKTAAKAADTVPAASDSAPASGDTAPAAVVDATPEQAASQSGTQRSAAPSGPPSGTTAPPNRGGATGPARSEPSVVAQRRLPANEPEPIDLLEVAGGAAMARYAAPAAAVAAVLLLVLVVVRRRRRG
ncbi:MAG TPA: SRPBCC domain-containing protein [Blastococcus sp.]|nr:SRPBCC domain-containing protein [Blastococcus sp.]